MQAYPRVCVVVPTYNERENIVPFVEALESLSVPSLSLLFVDDSSPDGTSDNVRELSRDHPWVSLLLRRGMRDFSAAYQEGFKEALTRFDPAVVVGMDADLQHPVSAIPSLVDAIRRGADLAIASRYVEGGGIEGWSLTRRVVSRGANAYARLVLGLKIRDCTSGFKAFGREAADMVARAELHAKHFEYQVATLKLLKGRRIVEVPFIFVSRKAGQSKLGFWDLPRFFFAVARMRLSWGR